jgi:chromate transporter
MEQPKSAPPIAASCAGKDVALRSLFTGCLKISLCGFGGGLVWARRVVVEQRGWMDEQEFAETLTLCQLMPGPNIIGITVCTGAKLRGAIGAATAVAGFLVVPWTLGLSIGSLVLRHAGLAALHGVLGGLSAAAAGLLIGTGLRLLNAYRSRWSTLLFAGLAFAGMAFTRLPLPLVLIALAPLSLAAAAFEGGRRP